MPRCLTARDSQCLQTKRPLDPSYGTTHRCITPISRSSPSVCVRACCCSPQFAASGAADQPPPGPAPEPQDHFEPYPPGLYMPSASTACVAADATGDAIAPCGATSYATGAGDARGEGTGGEPGVVEYGGGDAGGAGRAGRAIDCVAGGAIDPVSEYRQPMMSAAEPGGAAGGGGPLTTRAEGRTAAPSGVGAGLGQQGTGSAANGMLQQHPFAAPGESHVAAGAAPAFVDARSAHGSDFASQEPRVAAAAGACSLVAGRAGEAGTGVLDPCYPGVLALDALKDRVGGQKRPHGAQAEVVAAGIGLEDGPWAVVPGSIRIRTTKRHSPGLVS